MTDSVVAIPADSKTGVAHAAPAPEVRTPRPPASLGSVFTLLMLALVICGGGWAYLEGRQVFQSLPPDAGDAELWSHARLWQRMMAVVAAGAGGLLLVLLVNGCRSRPWGLAPESPPGEESNQELESLRARLSAKERVAADLLRERESLFAQITELRRARAALDDEVNRRRQAEKSLAQQRQELARSKDVLELHVQARAQELQKLQRRSELILNSAAEGICGLDLLGKITFTNPAAARVMRLSVSEMVGRPERELFPAFTARTDANASGPNGCQPTEVVATRPDGSTFAAEYLRSPIHENGRVVGEVLMFKDVTERKQAAEILAQRMAELTRSNAELEQFAFVASHDLQEPLRKIQAFGDRLKAKCDEAGLEQGRDYLERMQSAAARMQNLINDLLTFSRVIRRAEPFGPVDLAAVTREVLSDLEVRIEKSRAQVEVGELPTLQGDAVQIRQLLQNLIGNALKFQPPGATPVVKVQARRVVRSSGRGCRAIFTGQSADGGEVSVGEEFCELTVQDNGIGFDEKYLDKIFAVFARLHGRQEYEGTGIGLAVCQRIVDRHGGSITARSQPGQGATFIIHLPLKQMPPPGSPA
jgi:PAS domain S-box-containing protein